MILKIKKKECKNNAARYSLGDISQFRKKKYFYLGTEYLLHFLELIVLTACCLE